MLARAYTRPVATAEGPLKDSDEVPDELTHLRRMVAEFPPLDNRATARLLVELVRSAG